MLLLILFDNKKHFTVPNSVLTSSWWELLIFVWFGTKHLAGPDGSFGPVVARYGRIPAGLDICRRGYA